MPVLSYPRLIGLTAALALAVTVTGCTGGTQPSPTGSAAATATATASATGAAAAGAPNLPLDGAALTKTFDDLAKSMMMPGAAMLIRTPDGEVTATYGTTELNGSTPVSLDDHVRVGSNTKTWTATVILQLVQEGRIALTDPISKYRPDVPNGDNITVEEVLNMRSGLHNYTEAYSLAVEMDADPQKTFDPEELLALGLGLPPYFAPGTGYHYSNTNYVLLGLIAEKLDGKPLQQIFQDRLFTPLGLTNTSFPSMDDSSIPAPYSNGYMYTDNVRTLETTRLPADVLAQAEAGTLLPGNQTNSNPSWAWAAGSGISTIGDLATWVKALVGGGTLLNADLQQQRLQDVLPTAPGAPASYGWGIAKLSADFYGHTGELPGFNSFMAYDPVNEVTVVVWANLAPAATGVGPASTMAGALIKQLYGSATATPTPQPEPEPDDQ